MSILQMTSKTTQNYIASREINMAELLCRLTKRFGCVPENVYVTESHIIFEFRLGAE